MGVKTNLVTWATEPRATVTHLGAGTGFPVIYKFNDCGDYFVDPSYPGDHETKTFLDYVSGEIKWTIQWTEDYPGETPPTTASVAIQSSGHRYAAVSLMGTSELSSLLQVTDPWFSTYLYVSDPGFAVYKGEYIGDTTDRTLGTTTVDSGAFTEVSSGVYQATVDWDVLSSVGVQVDCNIPTGGSHSAAANIDMKVRQGIISIDGQPIP